MQYFFRRLDELFASKGSELDLLNWFQYFMFDVLGQLTFSRSFGCLDKGDDVDDIIKNNWRYFQQIAAVSLTVMIFFYQSTSRRRSNQSSNCQNTQMAWLDYLWRDNPLVPTSRKRNPLAEFGAARIQERMSLTEDEKKPSTKETTCRAS